MPFPDGQMPMHLRHLMTKRATALFKIFAKREMKKLVRSELLCARCMYRHLKCSGAASCRRECPKVPEEMKLK